LEFVDEYLRGKNHHGPIRITHRAMGQRMLRGSHWREPVVDKRRLGFTSLYRKAGMATVVCRLAPNNMGAADEYVDTDKL
jgi:hypothetical protein